MDTLVQLLMGVSLAACAGLRTWMPLLVVGLLGRSGFVHLSSSFDVLTHTGTLTALGVATVVEVLGDKVIAIDHFLDGIGTFLRPAAGTVLASSLLTGLDPHVALLLGLIAGGGAALTVHTGKSAVRAGTTALAPAHLGAGNAAVSFLEDILAFGGIWAAVLVPVVAFILIVALAWWVRRALIRVRAHGGRLWRTLLGHNP